MWKELLVLVVVVAGTISVGAAQHPDLHRVFGNIVHDVFSIIHKKHGDLDAAWVSNVSNNDTSFFFVDRNSPRTPIELTSKNLNLTNTTRPTKYLIHDWIEDINAKWYADLAKAYLWKGDVQIVLVEWSLHSYKRYADSANACKYIGTHVGEHIIKTGLPLHQVHIVGLGLGAHIAGFAGKHIKTMSRGKTIGRISALDPSGPLFEGRASGDRLFRSDATFVDITHTDSRDGFGSYPADGSIDFYPNGGVDSAPGCTSIRRWMTHDLNIDTLKHILCSHRRSAEYFIESVQSSLFLAKQCFTFLQLFMGTCLASVPIIYGDDVPLTAHGVYYFSTKHESPYAKG